MITIFLDIDGVLATHKEFMLNRTKFRSSDKRAAELGIPYPYNPGCVKIFNEILGSTETQIILSSDWKYHFSLRDMNEIFKHNGIVQSIAAFTDNDTISINNLTMNRAHQIGKYIEDNQIENWIALDDLWLHKYLDNGDGRFFLTKDNEGLKQSGLKNKIIKKLNGFS
jgi:hypothetical protein